MTETISANLRTRLANARGFIFDMDGTLALGDRASGGHQALPGAIAMLEWLRANAIPFQVFTNGTAHPPAYYAASLRRAGLPVGDEEMMTPSTAAADHFVRARTRKIRVLGGEGVWRPLADAGLDWVASNAEAQGVDAVYTGWFREFTFPDLEAACNAVWAGAKLYTASNVPFFASNAGRSIGSSFAINAMIRAMTGKRAIVLGKPSRSAFVCALRRMGLAPRHAENIVVVGDDPGLEMRLGNAAGGLSVGVATGLQTLETLQAQPEKQRPHIALSGIDQLYTMVSGKV